MELVTLKNGPSIPAPVLELALALEARGVTLHQQEPGVLRVSGPDGKPALSDQETSQIRQFKFYLLELVSYCAGRN